MGPIPNTSIRIDASLILTIIKSFASLPYFNIHAYEGGLSLLEPSAVHLPHRSNPKSIISVLLFSAFRNVGRANKWIRLHLAMPLGFGDDLEFHIDM